MPYIKVERRNHLDLTHLTPENAGELNYAITVLCRNYYMERGCRYQQVNDVLGALEGAKLEFYRRVAASYEDEKIKENGDVYN